MSTINKEDLLEAMAEVFAPKKKKAKKAKNKFVLIVDGRVQSQMATKLSEVKEAAAALTLNALARGNKAPKVAYATIGNTVSVDVPVVTAETNGIEA